MAEGMTPAHRNIAAELEHQPGPLDVVVVSPARPVSEGPAKHLSVMALNGSMGIWPRHTDIVAALGTGELRIARTDGSTERFAVSGGFLKVGGPRVTILVDRAVAAAEVDVDAARADLAEVQEALRRPSSDDEFRELLRRREWARSRLKIAEKA